jgi:hypothetical protein
VTGSGAIQVVVYAGGLGTRIAGWSRYIPSPLTALRHTPAGHPAVLGRAYQRELAASHGVIAAVRHHGELLVRELIEKPGLTGATELERRYGTVPGSSGCWRAVPG